MSRAQPEREGGQEKWASVRMEIVATDGECLQTDSEGLLEAEAEGGCLVGEGVGRSDRCRRG